jgi:exodeoxyribonuclease VII small subunit
MAAAPKDDPKDLPFEGHLDALEKVVADLEGDDLSLEASIDRYRVGVDHLSACRRILDAAEKRLAELVARADGSGVDEKPLAVGAEGLVDAGPAAESTSKRSAAAPRAPRKAAPPPPASSDGDDDDIPF